MFDKLKNILSKIDADYADLRYEIKRETSIVFNGRELTEIGANSADGYVLRVLKDGGFSSIAFTCEKDAERAIITAEKNAILISRHIRKPVRVEKTETVKEVMLPELEEDPKKITIDEKLTLTRKYNEIPLASNKVVTTNIGYTDVGREKYFINTEGSEVHEDLITTRLVGLITTRDGNNIQTVRIGFGGSTGFSVLRGSEEEFSKQTRLAEDLLAAKPVAGGTYNVILNPKLAGIFTHEAFGHFSEADLIEDSPSMREKMQIGARLGSDILSIKDDPTLVGELGYYKYDDEGVKARSVQLMKEGVLTGRLHSRRTAAAFSEPVSGHCVAEDYRYAPIIRMGTILIEPTTTSFDELLQQLGDGLYILDTRGGQTSGENFTFGAECGFVVKNGKLGEMVRDINISGNLYETMKNISGVGNDLQLGKIGGCGKYQMNIKSCHGSPHILINNVIIGGV